jgi:hypothetical protein
MKLENIASGYMMSVERAEAFQELAKAVYDYMVADFYSKCERDHEMSIAYKNLMDIIEKEDNDNLQGSAEKG